MTADYQGFTSGQGPSPGTPWASSTRGAGGGGHGGRGGRGANRFVTSRSHDSLYVPAEFGSGGGNGRTYGGGRGGGLLIFTVSYMLRLEGRISANGESANGRLREGISDWCQTSHSIA